MDFLGGLWYNWNIVTIIIMTTDLITLSTCCSSPLLSLRSHQFYDQFRCLHQLAMVESWVSWPWSPALFPSELTVNSTRALCKSKSNCVHYIQTLHLNVIVFLVLLINF